MVPPFARIMLFQSRKGLFPRAFPRELRRGAYRYSHVSFGIWPTNLCMCVWGYTAQIRKREITLFSTSD